MNNLIKVVAVLVVVAGSTGQLPKLVLAVRKAQVHLIQDTKASKWGRVPLLPASR